MTDKHHSTRFNRQQATGRPGPHALLLPSASFTLLTHMKDPVGIAHLPNQRHKIVAKRGTTFNLMVCGT